MAASSRAQVLDLYRAMLRESKRFSAYNYRTYAIRRIRDAFRENKNVKDPVQIQALMNKARRDLGLIRRQQPRDIGSEHQTAQAASPPPTLSRAAPSLSQVEMCCTGDAPGVRGVSSEDLKPWTTLHFLDPAASSPAGYLSGTHWPNIFD
ncbi:LYR motif-containing protein 4 isoform 1-T1 [Megaptera novaeangliae]